LAFLAVCFLIPHPAGTFAASQVKGNRQKRQNPPKSAKNIGAEADALYQGAPTHSTRLLLGVA